ncbi:hypothetical protein IQ64_40690 [Streptomyces stelliscabiei]|nr:hypothetical protein IQ64_40690 [Streptomyces stelliscabiei]
MDRFLHLIEQSPEPLGQRARHADLGMPDPLPLQPLIAGIGVLEVHGSTRQVPPGTAITVLAGTATLPRPE